MCVNIHLHSNHSECTLPKELLSWQAKLKSWKECGRKLSHYGIMCTEIQRNHVYYSHVGPMKCADIPTHVTYLYSCQAHIWHEYKYVTWVGISAHFIGPTCE